MQSLYNLLAVLKLQIQSLSYWFILVWSKQFPHLY